ncbi:MAG TPA: prenyltransferase/squalene oxidase repeat-containing protein [Planctomycetota bacterium]|nr:prenyltransferase/squalene oxidase repeat-containing protein [Planctomycetota bacterium]
MRRISGLPFLLSAALSASLAFWALRLADDRGSASRATTPAYFDYHVDVAHDGSALDSSLRFALQWLQRHQHVEGMWSARSFGQLCEGEACSGGGSDAHDVGVTALAVLAILESGPLRGRFEESARKGLAWLSEQQGLDGCVGRSSGKFMYGHALATLSFARACSILRADEYRARATKGARFLRQARNPGLAWRYGVRDGENDTSVTVWAGAALLGCAGPDVGVTIDPQVREGIRRSLAQATSDWTQETFYRRSGSGSSEDRFEKNEGLTAMALWLRLGMGMDRKSPEIRGAARRLGWCLPVWTPSGASVDFTAWFSGTRALAAYGDADLWEAWSSAARRLLVSHQRKYADGCGCGSWDPVDRWGSEGGRVYATALNALTLELIRSRNAP